jgi:hypothetical protein
MYLHRKLDERKTAIYIFKISFGRVILTDFMYCPESKHDHVWFDLLNSPGRIIVQKFFFVFLYHMEFLRNSEMSCFYVKE